MKSKLPLEAAIDKVGFGLYGSLLTCLTCLILFSFSCIAYGNTFIIPTSACELATTFSQQGLLAAGPVASLMLGGIVWSYLADTRGRRAMLLIGLTSGAIFNLIASISVNWIMLLIFQFISSLLSSGLFSMSLTLLSECIPLVSRNTVVLLALSTSLISQGFMAVLTIPINSLTFSIYVPSLGIYWNSWRTLLVVYSIPSMIAAIWLFFMHESPKFIFTKGDEIKALKILQSMYGMNKRGSKNEFQVKELVKDEVSLPANLTKAKDQILLLFKVPLLKYTILMLIINITQQLPAFTVWMPSIANQFMRIMNTGQRTNLTVCDILNIEPVQVDKNMAPCKLDETSLLMLLGIGTFLATFNLLVSFLVNILGRRNISLMIIFVCGTSGILVNLVPNVIGSAILFLIMSLGALVIGLCTTMCVAFFPTNLRAMAISLTMMAQYLGTVASVQILKLLLVSNCAAGFYLFSSVYASAAIALFFLPNDRQSQAEETTPTDTKL